VIVDWLLFLFATVVGFFCFFAFLLFCWHPRYVFGLQALPLCGAAPTFLCRRKEK
jgi:hypothetical protein